MYIYRYIPFLLSFLFFPFPRGVIQSVDYGRVTASTRFSFTSSWWRRELGWVRVKGDMIPLVGGGEEWVTIFTGW